MATVHYLLVCDSNKFDKSVTGSHVSDSNINNGHTCCDFCMYLMIWINLRNKKQRGKDFWKAMLISGFENNTNGYHGLSITIVLMISSSIKV